MTTNQTIDGVLVPRETLQKWLDDIGPSRHVTQYAALKRDELRALLDAPAPRAEFKKIEMAHVMNALEDVRGKPVLTSNQCHDLARALNDRLLSPLQLLAMPAEYLAAAQTQGVPVALTAVGVLRDDGDGGLAPEWTLEGGTAELWEGAVLLIAAEDQELCAEDGHCTLYRGQPAPVAVVLPEPMQDPGPIAGLTSRYAQGWNACLDELKRLNATVSAPTCCGSCPAGCVYGLKA